MTFSPEKADDVIRQAREQVVPRYEQSHGYKGFTLLLDRNSGRGLGISFWESEDALRQSDQAGDEARRGVAEAGGGRDEGAEHFEVAIDTMA